MPSVGNLALSSVRTVAINPQRTFFNSCSLPLFSVDGWAARGRRAEVGSSNSRRKVT